MMRQTSIDAFIALDDLSGRQRQVYYLLAAHGPLSNLQIAEWLHMPINSITPRTNELVAKCKVEEVYRADSPITGRRVIFWDIKL